MLLRATPSVLLIAWGPVMFLQGQDNRGRCLIIVIVHILRHPVDVPLFSFLSVAAPQNGRNANWLSFIISNVRTSGVPATDGFRVWRDNRQVMSGGLFRHPHSYQRDWVYHGPNCCKGLALFDMRAFFDLLILWKILTVVELAACLSCRHIIDPSLGVGGERVVPDVRRDSNCSALAVVHGQDAVGIHPCCRWRRCLSSGWRRRLCCLFITSWRRLCCLFITSWRRLCCLFITSGRWSSCVKIRDRIWG